MKKFFFLLALSFTCTSAFSVEICIGNHTTTDVEVEWFGKTRIINKNGASEATCARPDDDSNCNKVTVTNKSNGTVWWVYIQNTPLTPLLVWNGGAGGFNQNCSDGELDGNSIARAQGIGARLFGLFSGMNLHGIYMNSPQKGGDGVYRINITNNTVECGGGRSPDECALASASSWGTSATCPMLKNSTPSFAFGMCGSGENADCAGHPVQLACRTYDSLQVASNAGHHKVEGGWGQKVTCPGKSAVIKVCGSGRDANCDGESHVVICEDLPENASLGSSRWVTQTEFGDHLQYCNDGEIGTGYCGSGRNKDCGGDVAMMRCTQIE